MVFTPDMVIPPEKEALTKWKLAFETVEQKYCRNAAIASFAGNMAEYLDDDNGVDEFSTAYHKKIMKRLQIKEDQTKERVKKKMRIGLYEEVGQELDKPASDTEDTSPTMKNSIPIKKPIFNEGQRLHDLYIKGEKLTPKQRHLMVAGLSGILDLTNKGSNRQASLFTTEDWSKVKMRYENKYKMKPTPMEDWIKDTWTYVSYKCIEKSGIQHGRKFLDKLCASNITSEEYNTYKFFDIILDKIQNAQHILNPTYPSKILENDYTFTIWLPILERLFNINSSTNNFSIIKVKPGESVPVDSTSEMSYIYGDDKKNLIGFKVDLRFIYYFENEEFDMCNLECSREDADDEKTYKDHSKLIREGKTNTTTIYNINADIDLFHSWIIQACGLKLYFSTVVYAGKDLFVVVPQFNLNLPTMIGQLESFVSSIEYLLTFMQDMEKLAHASAAALHQARHNRTGKAIQRMNREDSPPPPTTSKKASVPGTVNWHTPPRNNAQEYQHL